MADTQWPNLLDDDAARRVISVNDRSCEIDIGQTGRPAVIFQVTFVASTDSCRQVHNECSTTRTECDSRELLAFSVWH